MGVFVTAQTPSSHQIQNSHQTISCGCGFSRARLLQKISVKNPRKNTVNINLSIGPLISLMAGILILMVPRLLNYIVAIYLIAMGLIGLFGAGNLHLN